MNSASTAPTASTRRAKYGFNVAIAAGVAVAIVVIVNALAYRFYHRVDLTETRRYSLSPQTRQVLDRLDSDVRLVTLLRGSNPYITQTRDLVSDYARLSGRLSAEHLVADQEIARVDAFYAELIERFDSELAPVREALDRAREALRELAEQSVQMRGPLSALFENPALQDGELKQFAESVAQAVARIDRDVQSIVEDFDERLDAPLPAYPRMLEESREALRQYDERLLTIAIEEFDRALARDLSAELTEQLKSVRGMLARTRESVRSALSALESASEAEAYATVRSRLSQTSNAVVVMGQEQVEVLGVEQMFRVEASSEGPAGQASSSGASSRQNVQFLGEEMLTGSLVKLQMDQMPLVVFMTASRQPVLGPRGAYTQVAERLEKLGFEVAAWNPLGTPGPMGRPQPPGEPPEPAPQQEAVWVVLPRGEPPNPMNPQSQQGPQRIAEHLKNRLDKGDSAFAMASALPGVFFGPVDPVVQLLRTWGLDIQTDRIILREAGAGTREPRAASDMIVRDWPEDSPITRALAGLEAIFLQTSPIRFPELEPDSPVRAQPLFSVTGERLWTEAQVEEFPDIPYNPETAAEAFPIAARAVNDQTGSRLIAIADPIWASDRITRLGVLGPGTASVFGARFPGNSELFVNAVYWLSKLDELIAASPRTQDIPRVQAMDRSELLGLRWALLIGIPTLIVVTGLSVWAVRRRS